MKPDKRALGQALARRRLNSPVGISYPGLLWAALNRVTPNIPLTGRGGAVTGVAFGTSGDGRLLLASCSFDKMVRLWDPATGSPVG